MSRILKTVDQIAREKQRSVLFVTFHKEDIKIFDFEDIDLDNDDDEVIDLDDDDEFDYEQCDKRKVFIQWLDENDISFQECFGFEPGAMSMSYLGQIYIDVPYDESNPQYQLINQYVENPDGSLKDPDVTLYCLPLEMAMEYKHLDDPEYLNHV